MADLEPCRATLWEPDTEARRQDRLAQQDRDRRHAIWAIAGTGGAALLLAPLATAAGFPFPFFDPRAGPGLLGGGSSLPDPALTPRRHIALLRPSL
jgi:hypothetical protein